MKIAILAPVTFALPPAGYAPWEKVVHTLAKGLFEKGVDVTVFTCKESHAGYPLIKTIPKCLSRHKDFQFQREMIHLTEALKIIRKEKFDLVNNHLHWNGLLGLESIGANYVTTLHGFEGHSKFVFNSYRDSRYISISYAERKDAPRLNYVGNAYNGVDFDYFTLETKKEDYLFCNSRIIPYKGVHLAIELAKKLGKKLYLAGLIHDRDYYREKIKPQIDNEQIIYLGVISQEEIKKYTARASALVSLISWNEPFGLSVAEAIASGTPVIATPRGSMPELVKEGSSGILVNSVAEAVSRFEEIKIISPKVCREYGYNLFSTERMLDSYLEIFKRILS